MGVRNGGKPNIAAGLFSQIMWDKKKKKKNNFYGIGYGFSWHTAIINALQWQPPLPSALPHPPALPVLCKPWEIALSQAWPAAPLGASRAKGCPFPNPARGFQSRQGRVQDSCRESEGVRRRLGELNKASVVTRITGNQTAESQL